MRILGAVLAILITTEVTHSQTFEIQKGRYRADFNECQKNHHRIYDRAIEQIDLQFKEFGNRYEQFALSEEKKEFRSNLFRSLFAQLVLKKITMQKMQEQFNSRNLNDFILSEYARQATLSQKDPNYRIRSFMDYENLEFDIERAVSQEITALSVFKSSLVGDYFKLTISWQFTKTLLTHTFSLFYKIGGGLFAHASVSALKSAALHIGSSLFVNALKGSLITILIDPLMGARLPPETEWTDLLQKYPELIVYPEWMAKAKVGDGFAWQTHCQALTTRTSYMEDRLAKYLKNDQKDFKSSLNAINFEFDSKTLQRMNARPSLDNTHVAPRIIPRN